MDNYHTIYSVKHSDWDEAMESPECGSSAELLTCLKQFLAEMKTAPYIVECDDPFIAYDDGLLHLIAMRFFYADLNVSYHFIIKEYDNDTTVKLLEGSVVLVGDTSVHDPNLIPTLRRTLLARARIHVDQWS